MFHVWCFLCARNVFVKIINRFEIVSIASIYDTTDGYPNQPAYRKFIFTHLLSPNIICEHLFLFMINREHFFLSVRIIWNLFHLCESICTNLFSPTIICEHLFFLWKSFWIFFICENLFFFMRIVFYFILWVIWVSLLVYFKKSFSLFTSLTLIFFFSFPLFYYRYY